VYPPAGVPAYAGQPYSGPPAGGLPASGPPYGVPAGGPQYGAPTQGRPPSYAPPAGGSQIRVPTAQGGVPYTPPPAPAYWQGQTMVPAMNAVELVIEAGAGAGQRFPLQAQTRLGRAADNDVVLRDPQSSRHHAVITLNGPEYAITDLGSANGTLVNGARIQQPCPLRPNDLITIGSQQLRVRQV
jgi:hypothetical protein